MSFAAAWEAACDVEGWLTEAQARRLFAAAARCRPAGGIVEIGSFRGRSAIVLARGARPDVEVVCIDPHAGSDRGPREIAAQPALGEADLAAFPRNLERAGVSDRVRHLRDFSTVALRRVRRARRPAVRRRRAPLRAGPRRPRALGRARPRRRDGCSSTTRSRRSA